MDQRIRQGTSLLTRQKQHWDRFCDDSNGAGAIEYALIAGLISVITMGAMIVVSEEQDETYDCLSASIDMGEQSVICAEIGTIS